MEIVMKTRSVVATTAFCLLLIPGILNAQAPPPQEKLVFENQYVKAYKVTLSPGEKLPPHQGGERIIYSLNNYTLRYRWEGKTSEEKRKAGDVHFHPSALHAEENSGKSPAQFLIVERTAAPLPPAGTGGPDMAKMNPNNTRVLFDRDMAKVFEVNLYPRGEVSQHYGMNRLVYSFGNGPLVTTTEDGKQTRETVKKDSFQWHQAGMHSVQNAGGSTVRLLVFGFKK